MPRNIERDKREADRRKNQLIEAGFRLFSQNGIETVSLQKVADAANVSPATMYKYFLTKEKLLIAISAKVWDEVWQEALGDPGTNHFEHFTAYQGIEFYADRMIALYKNRPEVLRFSGEYKTYMMFLHIKHQLVQHRTSTNESKDNLSSISRLGPSLKLLHNFDKVLKVVVQTDIAGVHDDELAIQTVFFLESNNSLIALIQRIDLVLINPVVNHNGLRNFLSLETVLYRLHQITADCDHKVTALAAELVEPHHGIGDELTLSVADSQHLLRVKVLNVINVLCVFYPLAPNAQ